MPAISERSSNSVVIPVVIVCSKKLGQCFACMPAGENFRSIDGKIVFGRDTVEAELCRQAIKNKIVNGLMVEIR